MKKIILSLLCLALVFVFLIPLTVLAETEESPAGRIISEPVNSFDELGLQTGIGTGHGNNQTRIAYTSTGVYITSPLEDTQSVNFVTNLTQDATRLGLWRIKNDGTVEFLIEDYVFYIGAGGTSNVMVDNDEHIWMVTSWNEGSGFYALIAWEYDPFTEESHVYREKAYYRKGSGYGKANTIMDPTYNRMYQVAFGGEKAPGHMIWCIFDIETKTWTKNCYYYKAPCCCYYHFAYPTGKGGFFFETLRTLHINDVMTDVEGLCVRDAMWTLHSRPKNDTEQVWDEAHIVYVPDATEAKVYDQTLMKAEYHVERGMYPTVNATNTDVFYDEDTGLFYILMDATDCNSEVGLMNWFYIVDTKKFEGTPEDEEFFPVLVRKKMSFIYGQNEWYNFGFCKDLENNMYIVVSSARQGEIQIWQATDELRSNYKLVYYAGLDESYSQKTYSQWNRLISCTKRNNSMVSDKSYFLYSGARNYQSFYVDFAALRDYLANK